MKIQDGRQDGFWYVKHAITPILHEIEQWFWCLGICFGGQGIHFLHQIYYVMSQNSKIQDGCQDGFRYGNHAITPLLHEIEQWFWCLGICFWGQGIHFLHQIYYVMSQNSKIQDGYQDGFRYTNHVITPLLHEIEQWFGCLGICFWGQGIHCSHQICCVMSQNS